MIKKIIFSLLLFFGIITISAHASVNSLVKIGGKYYDSLIEAIANAGSSDTIVLISDVNLDDTILINKTININLNGNDITASSKVFEVQGGVLNISGKGTIKETKPDYGAIMMKGSSDSSDKEYSVVNVGSDVTLEGWSGVFITHDNNKSHGVVANIDGKINAVNDVDGDEGAGVYINGNIKHQTNHPIVNILDNAEIISTGNGLYIAGYTTVNIGKAYISGLQSGIGMKAGILNINGATVVSEGEDKTPTSGYNNGIKSSGTAIQIESNNGYAGDMKINITDGKFKSKNSNVIYEYIGKGTSSLVDSINVSGGTFISEVDKDVFRLSDSFKTNHNSFINGGKYSSDPSSFVKSGYTSVLEQDLYNVIKATLKEVNYDNISVDSNNNLVKWLIAIICIVSIALIYFNRNKILKIIKNK